MRQGFIKVAAVTVDIRVADVWHNCEEICKRMKEAEKAGAKIIVFPELCLTGYTCSTGICRTSACCGRRTV